MISHLRIVSLFHPGGFFTDPLRSGPPPVRGAGACGAGLDRGRRRRGWLPGGVVDLFLKKDVLAGRGDK